MYNAYLIIIKFLLVRFQKNAQMKIDESIRYFIEKNLILLGSKKRSFMLFLNIFFFPYVQLNLDIASTKGL